MKPHREPGSREGGFVTQQDVLRACASELKMACLDLLAQGPMCVSDMIPRLGWTQPEVSRALVALRELGLVEFVVQGPRHHLYRPGPAVTVRNNGHTILRFHTSDSASVTIHRSNS